ncbi:MAG: S9 family peptidase [Prevotella sp.]|nr:S9 family peptidase [Prevotella sp.]
MKRSVIYVAMAALMMLPCQMKAQEMIGKNNIKLQSNRLTPEALWAMGRISTVAASPDGSKVAYQVGYYSVKQNKSRQVICVMDCNSNGSNKKQLSTSQKSETDPAWLDTETIAYISDGEIWSVKANGTERKQLSQTGGEVEGFLFSPDRTKVIILKSIPFHEVIKKNPDDLPKATGRRVTEVMFRHWDHYVESIQHPFVATVTDGFTIGSGMEDILEGEPYECPMEPFGGIEQLAWSPDSKTIAYTCRKKTGMEYSISTDSDIYLYDINTKKTRNICKPADYKAPEVDPTRTLAIQAVNAPENLKNNVGYDQNPQFSPDGKYIAWLSMERDGYEADLNRLCIYDMATGEKSYVDWKSDIDAFCWAPSQGLETKEKTSKNGKKITTSAPRLYFLSVWEGCCNMYTVLNNGKVGRITEGWNDWTSLQMANKGNIILGTCQSLSHPTDIYMVQPSVKYIYRTDLDNGQEFNANAEIWQMTTENDHILSQLQFGKMEQYWVPTSDGKKELVWVMLPSNYEEGKKYPTLLFCEGGPQSPVSQFWSYRWNFQIMAANGYVVIAPNRHGLPGFGQEWKEQISGDWTGQCMQDYLAAIDFAADNLPYVDRDRMGAVGASFGGFSVYFLAGIHEKRFKCFIAHDGAFNLASMYLETEENWFSNWEYDEAYWHRPQMPRAKKTYHDSPHKMVEKWDTPILCIHGEKDYRINYTQGMQAFNAARMKGIPAEFLVFPDENHWVLKPQNGILWQRTFFEWLDRWLKN